MGVRELRQNLSIYLDRVKQGAALQVTEHGRVVAVLRPVPPNASRYDILLAQGLITPATKSIRDLPPPRKMPPGSRPMSEILDEMRRGALLTWRRTYLDTSALVKLRACTSPNREALVDYLAAQSDV